MATVKKGKLDTFAYGVVAGILGAAVGFVVFGFLIAQINGQTFCSAINIFSPIIFIISKIDFSYIQIVTNGSQMYIRMSHNFGLLWNQVPSSRP